MLGVAFGWLIFTTNHFLHILSVWASSESGGEYIVGQIVLLVLKNIPTVLAVIIATHWWEDSKPYY